jgi:deoxyribonuclease-4
VKVGAHVSTAGGLANAFDRALEIGAEAIQIFGAPPQSWRVTEHSDADVERFRARMAETGIEPAFIHAAYLINLGTPDATLLTRSLGSLKFGLGLCSRIGAAGVIFHVGSHKGRGFDAVRDQIVESVLAVLEATPDDATLVLENSAGMGGSVGSKFTELGAIMRGADSPRVKVCLDTQHSYAAGYDVASREGLEATVEEFEREVGLDALVAVHANDSKIPLGGGVDRHENIGEGEIGREGFLAIMGHRAFRGVPFLLEVPGFEKTGPDKANVDILRELRRESGADP